MTRCWDCTSSIWVKEKGSRVPVSCLKDGHGSLLVSLPSERSGVTDVGAGAMDHAVAEEEHTKVSSEDRQERKKRLKRNGLG